MRNTVEGFGKINCNCRGPCWGLTLIEALSNGHGQGKKCGNGGVEGLKTMLGRNIRKGSCEEREKASFKDLGRRAEE